MKWAVFLWTSTVLAHIIEYMLRRFYSLACFLLPCILWYIVNRKKLEKKENMPLHLFWCGVFLVYLHLAAWDAADIGTIWDTVHLDHMPMGVNLRPFSYDGNARIATRLNLLNIFMFLPLGFLLPLIWKEHRSFIRTALTGLYFSLLIELCQLFNHRATDVDDLIMNTLGAVIGWGIWRIYSLLFKNSGKRSVSVMPSEAIWLISLGVAGIFLLYNRYIGSDMLYFVY